MEAPAVPCVPKSQGTELPHGMRRFPYLARAMTVVFVTIMHPGGGFTGAEVATRAFVDALRSGGRRVVLVTYRRSGQSVEPGPDDVIVADRHIETSAAGAQALGWLASSL